MGIRNTIKKLIRSVVQWSVGQESNKITSTISGSYGARIDPDNTWNRGEGVTCTIYNANGGKVIRFSSYDSRTDRASSALYIISDSEDFGKEFGQIITRETLTR